ncbi:hypothetical protein HYH03_012471 [Edaphochlamys debaryana]|uniref:EF-hand domain-containing protein n=1 Tax=Edaphochlamys debaryana TaxID=47281 RepID=A0A835XRR7_9CHLO|nr:hypothetical protein HYH03_012471 [Edaphochlamys debaryana]|eukprot:KAG2489033.1 hypothetical protein HYH03_012471 [Edaphochlamys debaryana]
MPRAWTAEDRKRAWAASMSAWNALDATAKQELRSVFNQGDKDGDNTWSRDELKQFLEKSFGPEQAARLQDLWSLVDANGDGSLDFYEVGTLVYVVGLEKTSCCRCREPIYDDSLMACRTCCTQHVQCNGQRPSDWIALCEACERVRRVFRQSGCPNDPSHVLERVAHDPFVNRAQCPLYRELSSTGSKRSSCSGSVTSSRPSPPPTPPQQPQELVQCRCCTGMHALVPGYLKGSGGSHMVPAPGGSGYICELCAVWMCESCGAQGCDVHHPQIGKWRKTLVHVNKCSRVGEGRWRFDARPLVTASADTSRPHCPTCLGTFKQVQAQQQADEAAAQQAAQRGAAQAAHQWAQHTQQAAAQHAAAQHAAAAQQWAQQAAAQQAQQAAAEQQQKKADKKERKRDLKDAAVGAVVETAAEKVTETVMEVVMEKVMETAIDAGVQVVASACTIM